MSEGWVDDPILYLGLDIGIKRDTTGLVALYLDQEDHCIHLWGHRIFPPPVNLVTQVEPVLFGLFAHQRVAAMMFDPYMAATTEQRLREQGYASRLLEVNQMTAMVEAANTLHACLTEGKLTLYPDPELRSQFAYAAAKQTERGWRIIKQKQSRPIDAVIAMAMALWGMTQDVGHSLHPAFNSQVHARSAWDLV